jgi:hypothetical protein
VAKATTHKDFQVLTQALQPCAVLVFASTQEKSHRLKPVPLVLGHYSTVPIERNEMKRNEMKRNEMKRNETDGPALRRKNSTAGVNFHKCGGFFPEGGDLLVDSNATDRT